MRRFDCRSTTTAASLPRNTRRWSTRLWWFLSNSSACQWRGETCSFIVRSNWATFIRGWPHPTFPKTGRSQSVRGTERSIRWEMKQIAPCSSSSSTDIRLLNAWPIAQWVTVAWLTHKSPYQHSSTVLITGIRGRVCLKLHIRYSYAMWVDRRITQFYLLATHIASPSVAARANSQH